MVRLLMMALLLALAAGCDEGPAERAGREVDEAAEELRHGSEGAMERAGRKTDEALGEAKEKMEELGDKIERELED
ncbi:MAG TPA: hypothetical protein VEB21_06865 [Terriglobales bacterium]|nr:hypothetical protein [Terriglobales bacterium]